MSATTPFDAWLQSQPFRGVWVTVLQSRSELIGPPYVNGMLAQADDPRELLTSVQAPSHGLGGVHGAPAGAIGEPPSFLVGHSNQAGTAMFWSFGHVVERPGGDHEIEPLQLFLAHFAAWPEHVRAQKRWYRLNRGEEQMIARWTPDPNDAKYAGTLEIYRPALLKYMYDMELHFAFFFDVRADGSDFPDDWSADDTGPRRVWRAWNTSGSQLLSDRSQAMMLGVEILLRPEQDSEAEPDEARVEYMVALDPDSGAPIKVSFPSEPNPWTVWEGAGRNNFLTPLYFKPSVLERYHADPRLYTVEPATCAPEPAGGYRSR